MRLVHLSPASAAAAIRRGGLRGTRSLVPGEDGRPVELPRAVFAMPVLESWWTTLQWLRELRPAAADAAWVRENPAGAEVVLPRSVGRREVLGIRELPQLVGWTGVPPGEAAPDCLCPACLPKGRRDLMRRLRAGYQRGLRQARAAPDLPGISQGLRLLELPLERARGRIEPGGLLKLARHGLAAVRRTVASLLGLLRRSQAEATLVALAADPDPEVRDAAISSLWRVAGLERARLLLQPLGDAARAELERVVEDWG